MGVDLSLGIDAIYVLSLGILTMYGARGCQGFLLSFVSGALSGRLFSTSAGVNARLST